MSIIFLDSEGSPIQELSAIQIDAMTREIVDVYHGYACSEESDTWARRHVHGLNQTFLTNNGHASESALIAHFRKWLRGKDVLAFYGQAPQQERERIQTTIHDMNLPPWAKRITRDYHSVANAFKVGEVPILHTHCPVALAHRDFSGYPLKRMTDTEVAKHEHGVHCSLYDTFELYLAYVMNAW